MNRFVLRVPDELYNKIREQAANQGVSINQYLLYTITRTVSAEETRAFFAVRAVRGDTGKALKLLDQVSDDKPTHVEDHIPRSQGGRQRR